MIKKILAVIAAILIPTGILIGAQQSILNTDTVKDALYTKVNANFTELYNYVTGTSSPTLLTPTIASFANATHTHTNAAGGGTLTAAVLGGTITGTYTLGGTPTITTPTITVADWTAVSSFGTRWVGSGVYYMKDPLGFVHLKGYMRAVGGSGTNPAFTLPTGYRPSATRYIPFCFDADGANVGTININSSGEVSPSLYAENTWAMLDGVIFKAE